MFLCKNISSDDIFEYFFVSIHTWRLQPDHKRLAMRNFLFNVRKLPLSPQSIITINTWCLFCQTLSLSDIFNLFLAHPTWIGKSLSYKIFCKHMIQSKPLGLGIGTIRSSLFCCRNPTLSCLQTKLLEPIDDQ